MRVMTTSKKPGVSARTPGVRSVNLNKLWSGGAISHSFYKVLWSAKNKYRAFLLKLDRGSARAGVPSES